MCQEKQFPNGSAEEQAAQWLVRRHSGAWSFRDEQALQTWIASDPRNEAAYRRVASLWQGLDQFKPGASARSPRSTRVSVSRFSLGLAAAVLLILVLQTPDLAPVRQIYRTAKGETASTTLGDGTRIELNTDSELVADLRWFRRQITLNRGEALFVVRHERWRPFEVKAGTGRIIDIGTSFNVYRSAAQLEVSVLEGEVEVESRREHPIGLVAGQRIRIDGTGANLGTDRPDLTALTAWRSGQMILELSSLEDVAAQLSRYHAVQFVFDDSTLRRLKVSGTFTTQDLPLFLRTLEKIYPLKAIWDGVATVHFAPR